MASLCFDNFDVRLVNVTLICIRKNTYILNQRGKPYLMVLLDKYVLARRGFRNARSSMASLCFDNFDVRLVNVTLICIREHAYIPNQRDELYPMVLFNVEFNSGW